MKKSSISAILSRGGGICGKQMRLARGRMLRWKKLLAREEVARRVEAALSDLLHAFPF